MHSDIIIALSLFITGFLYASVGHGGASGYIAVLSLYAIPVNSYKPLILILNMLVAGVAFVQFSKAGYFKWKIIWPFLLTSLPAAFIGSKFPLHANIYNLLLGLALIIPVIRLIGIVPAEKSRQKEISILPAVFIGGLLGFLAGMLNIGGGIFLSPVLLLLGWASAKETAAASALFILMNSVAGLLGSSSDIHITASSTLWFLTAAAGGSAGAYLGSRHFPQVTVRLLLSAVLFIASCKLIFFM